VTTPSRNSVPANLCVHDRSALLPYPLSQTLHTGLCQSFDSHQHAKVGGRTSTPTLTLTASGATTTFDAHLKGAAGSSFITDLNFCSCFSTISSFPYWLPLYILPCSEQHRRAMSAALSQTTSLVLETAGAPSGSNDALTGSQDGACSCLVVGQLLCLAQGTLPTGLQCALAVYVMG
jgi:hypothetical protein